MEVYTPPQPPDPQKLAALRSLPSHIRTQMTREEVDAFLFKEEWPDSLVNKLKEYMVEEDEQQA